jgi:hypothetical protein
MSISIAKDFSDVPAGRYLTDGDYTGERFRDDFLIPALKKASKDCPVVVDINDVEGYGSSFLEEAFGGLIRKHSFTEEDLKNKLKIKANNSYDIYKQVINLHIKEAQERK